MAIFCWYFAKEAGRFFTAHGSYGSIVFSIVTIFLCEHSNLWTAALDEILHTRVLWQSLEAYLISTSKVFSVFVCLIPDDYPMGST